MNKGERNLKKGSGYFWDLLLIGSFGMIGGLMGFPFLCAATVRSVTHVSSLTIMSTTHAPGDKPKMEGAHEQRLTGFFVHVLMGKLLYYHNLCSILLNITITLDQMCTVGVCYLKKFLFC